VPVSRQRRDIDDIGRRFSLVYPDNIEVITPVGSPLISSKLTPINLSVITLFLRVIYIYIYIYVNKYYVLLLLIRLNKYCYWLVYQQVKWMFSWFAYRIIADFCQTTLRHIWWPKWQCDRILSESLEFLLSLLFYREVNLKAAHNLEVCSYIRNLAHARTVCYITYCRPSECLCPC
jgi:hypothetical protein